MAVGAPASADADPASSSFANVIGYYTEVYRKQANNWQVVATLRGADGVSKGRNAIGFGARPPRGAPRPATRPEAP